MALPKASDCYARAGKAFYVYHYMLSGMTRVMLSDNDDTVSSSGGGTVFF